MSEKYTGQAQDRRYSGVDVDITYNVKRCIHAENCINQLAPVFDKQRRPWISPDGAVAGDVATMIGNCPSGALHYERKDGGAAEAIPERNIIMLWQDGPLQFNGELVINGATVAIASETRATLCRCGASQNKPFCDNSHKNIGFSAQVNDPQSISTDMAATGGSLNITALPDGPLQVEGNLEIRDEAGNTLYTGTKITLCRCGGSGNKPFCDGTHNSNQFQSE
jgi:CDGSH-type Zn-finger protein/uncharacterized Fe-S cluster protein YjdI